VTRIVAAIITGTVERRQSTPGKVIDDAMGAFSGVMGEWLRLLGWVSSMIGWRTSILRCLSGGKPLWGC